MKCPYCGEEMTLGYIQPAGGRNPCWLPEPLKSNWLGFRYFSVGSIEQAGGRVLGTTTEQGLFCTSLSDSLLCPRCDILITKLEDKTPIPVK